MCTGRGGGSCNQAREWYGGPQRKRGEDYVHQCGVSGVVKPSQESAEEFLQRICAIGERTSASQEGRHGEAGKKFVPTEYMCNRKSTVVST